MIALYCQFRLIFFVSMRTAHTQVLKYEAATPTLQQYTADNRTLLEPFDQ